MNPMSHVLCFTSRGFCSTCAIQLESCPICRQEISERKELIPCVSGLPSPSIPASDNSIYPKDIEHAANGSNIPKDLTKDLDFKDKGKYFSSSSKSDRSAKTNIEDIGGDLRTSVDEPLEGENGYV